MSKQQQQQQQKEAPVARAHTIWLAERAMGQQSPLAAFTVKHELVTWLKGRSVFDAPVRIYKMRDGSETSTAHVMTQEDFLAQETGGDAA